MHPMTLTVRRLRESALVAFSRKQPVQFITDKLELMRLAPAADKLSWRLTGDTESNLALSLDMSEAEAWKALDGVQMAWPEVSSDRGLEVVWHVYANAGKNEHAPTREAFAKHLAKLGQDPKKPKCTCGTLTVTHEEWCSVDREKKSAARDEAKKGK